MKTGMIAGCLIWAMSSFAYADATCTPILAKRISREGKSYTFSATSTCTINKNSNANRVTEVVWDFLGKAGTISQDRSGSKEEFSGTLFDYQEYTPDRGNGDITVTYDAFLGSQGSAVSFVADSKDINANGNTERTEAVTIKTTYKTGGGTVSADIEKIVTIKKPSFAPEGIFESKVKGILKQELTFTQAAQNDILKSL